MKCSNSRCSRELYAFEEQGKKCLGCVMEDKKNE